MSSTEYKNLALTVANDVRSDSAGMKFYAFTGIVYALLYIGSVLSDKLGDITNELKKGRK